MNIRDIMNKYYNPTMLSTNDINSYNETYRRSILGSGYTSQRYEVYTYFCYLIRDKQDYIKFVNSKIAQLYDGYKDIIDNYMQDILDTLKTAVKYIEQNSMEENLNEYITASVLTAEFCRFGHFKVFVIPKMRPVNNYDIARYYLFYKTVQLLNIDYNKLNISQSKIDSIEFGNLMIKLPIINNCQLTPNEAVAALKFTELNDCLNLAEAEKNIFKLLECNSLEIYNPTQTELIKTIENLKVDENDFAILESSKPISNCTFIQTVKNEDLSFIIEAQIIVSENLRKIYSKETKDMNIIKDIFQSFLTGHIPDISDWEIACQVDIKPDIKRKRKVCDGYIEKYINGKDLKAMYENAYYCSKKHPANITNLSANSYLECMKIQDNIKYRIFYSEISCYIFDFVTDDEICFFGHFIIENPSDQIQENTIKNIDCKKCGVSMEFHFGQQGKFQGYLQCTVCKQKGNLILLGYRSYSQQFGKCTYKMSNYFEDLIGVNH